MAEKNKAAGGDRQPELEDTYGSVNTNKINKSIIPQFNRTLVRDFLENIFGGNANGFIGISYENKEKKGFYTESFQMYEWEKILSFCEKKFDNSHLWFSLGIRKEHPGKTKRGTEDLIKFIPGLWLDIDCSEGNHSRTDLPTYEEAKTKLLSHFLKPTVLVDSGGGLHAYWLFPEVESTETEAARKVIKDLSVRFLNAFRNIAKVEHSWHVDNTSDLARVLRLPSSINYKGEPKEVQIVSEIEKRYTIDELVAAIEELEAKAPQENSSLGDKRPQKSGNSVKVGTEKKPPLEPIVNGCEFLRHCRDDANGLSEPEWSKMAWILAFAEDGRETVHEWSKPDPRYSFNETDSKINHAIQGNTGPTTCQRIQEDHGMKYCEGCQFNQKITSPIVIGTEVLKEEERLRAIEVIEEAIEKTKNGDPGAVFETDVIDRLLHLETFFKPDFERQKQALTKAKVPLRSLRQELDKRKTFVEQEKESEGRSPLDQWSVRDNQLFKGWKVVTRTIPEIKRVLTNDIDGQEYWEISFKTVRGRPVSVIVPRGRMTVKKGLNEELSKFGFDVTDKTAQDIVDYLLDYDAAKSKDIPVTKYLDRFGWTEDRKSFLIGNDVIGQKDITYQAPGEGEKQLADAFEALGTLHEWKEIIPLLKGRKWALFKLFQSFLPPLLPILELNGYTFANHGESSQGKTMSDSIAGSVWGNVNYRANKNSLIVQGMNITQDKAEKVLYTLAHIPVFLQDVHETKPEVILNIIHAVELGQGKARGHNSNGSQRIREIHTLLYLTSEAPLASASQNGGAFTRSIEFSGSVFGKHDLLFKRKVMNIIFENYGHPGRSFVEYLIQNREKWGEWRKELNRGIEMSLEDLKSQSEDIDTKLEKKIEYFVAVQAAATIAKEALDLPITDEEIVTTIQECTVEQFTESDSAPYYEKALAVLQDWMALNKMYFWVNGAENNRADSRHGIPGLWDVSKGYVAMTKITASEVLKGQGYDINRCLNEWTKAGYLLKDRNGKNTISTYLPYTGTTTRLLRFPLLVFQGEDEEE